MPHRPRAETQEEKTAPSSVAILGRRGCGANAKRFFIIRASDDKMGLLRAGITCCAETDDGARRLAR